MNQTIQQRLQNKKVAIWGFGREGKSTLAFLISIGNHQTAVFDDNPEALKALGSDAEALSKKADLNAYDLIMKSPGIAAVDSPEVESSKLSSQTELFLEAYRAQIIGITGTKGKSTTTTLIYEILKSVHENTVLVGNIGIPCFDLIDRINKNTRIVFELSCHQLEYAKCSPHIALLLNIFQEHLDHYKTMERYIAAKENILVHQHEKDCFISSIGNTAQNVLALSGPSTLVTVSDGNQGDVRLLGNEISTPSGHIVIEPGDTSLIGRHNLVNIAFAYYVCHDLYAVDNGAFKAALRAYGGLPHRLQRIATLNGTDYFDDSISTVPETAIAAVLSLGNVGSIIIGGMDRGIDYHPLTGFLAASDILHIVLLPDTAARIHEQLSQKGCTAQIHRAADMADAVAYCKAHAERGKCCLLSPAAASYGFYRDFEARGDHFKALVTSGAS